MAENGNFPDLVGKLYQWKAAQWQRYPCRSNRASSLAGDCERELVYARTAWREAAEPDLGLKVIFQEGSKHEDALLRECSLAGLEVREQQVAMEWREYEITGHVDAVVYHDGSVVPLEIKSMSPHIWDSIFRAGPGIYFWADVAERFQAKPWTRKYLGQLTLYMLMRNAERGLMLCINKGTGALAQVNFPLDYAEGERLLARAERINAAVRSGVLPDRIPFDIDVCPHCQFYHVCLPDQVGKPAVAFVPEATIQTSCEDRERLQGAVSAFQEADERVKSWAKARDEESLVVGDWLIQKKTNRAGAVRVDIRRIEVPKPGEEVRPT